jgi:hypothetical protein
MHSSNHLDRGAAAISGCVNVEARHFHSMRGHVADGVLVRFATGAIRRVSNTMQGWTLTDGKQRQLFAPVASAMALTAQIVALDTNGSAVDVDVPVSQRTGLLDPMR